MERKIEIVCMELIKPLSPTPKHLRYFEFSYLDQMAVPIFAPIVFYYAPPHSESAGNESQAKEIISSRLLLLKKSLSETLATFYPFAGRIKDNSIECNDDGVPFYEAFAHNYEFEDVLMNPDLTKHFLPSVLEGGSAFHNSAFPLLVKVTAFKCGGMTIGMCVSHKVADGSTLFTLANAWTITARGNLETMVPEFVAAAKFLPPPILQVKSGPKNAFELINFFFNEQRVLQIFSFDASTIASLKAKAVSNDVQVPTRLEVISAVIWKCAMAASGNGTRSSRLAHQVNIRKRFDPPLPNHCVGNAVAVATACKGENDVSDLPTLVTCIRKGFAQLCSKYVEKHSRDEAILAIPYDYMELTKAHFRGELDIQINSMCGYKFYDADFGWGKPSWVSLNLTPARNVIRLMDSRDSGGIEAWVCLKDKAAMSIFEHELKELLVLGSDSK